MKVIILAGGLGIRLSEYTDTVPKPMVTIGGRPILWHIMESYAKFSYKEFVVALGYKSEVIKEYFLHYRSMNSDLTVDLASGRVTPLIEHDADWNVTLVDTGVHSMTGGRVLRIKPHVEAQRCLLTYGDGLADINLRDLVAFHEDHGKLVTVTAVRPTARFGELKLNGDAVTEFQEKPQVDQGWINGGYFVIEPEFFDYIDGDSTILERAPLERVAKAGELMAFRHDGFWHCMDTKRDRDALEELWKSGNPPWVI